LPGRPSTGVLVECEFESCGGPCPGRYPSQATRERGEFRAGVSESDNVDVEGGINVDKFELCIYRRSSVLLYLNVFREPGFGENSSRNKLNLPSGPPFVIYTPFSQILGSTLRRRAPKLS
jgi:hypothetical protein